MARRARYARPTGYRPTPRARATRPAPAPRFRRAGPSPSAARPC